MSALAEEMAVIDPVGRFKVDGAVVRVQEWFIRPIDQNVWKQKSNRCRSAQVLDHVRKGALRILKTQCRLLPLLIPVGDR